MVQITVDTERDSTDTLRHLIHFLDEELKRRGAVPLRTTPIEPMRVESSNPFEIPNSTPQQPSEPSPPSSNSFNDMFGGNNNSISPSPSTYESSQSHQASTPDMFSAFSHDAPSQDISSSQTTPSAESFISSQMTSDPQETPTASQLLEEDDIQDVTEHLARQVWKNGSTRKSNSDLNLEPY